MKWKNLFILAICFFSFSANALNMEKKNHAIYIDSATTNEVETLFKQYNFEDFSKIRSKFPRIYIKTLPSDWKDVPDSDEKHRIFIKILIPLVMKVNEEILDERQKILEIKQKYENSAKISNIDLKFMDNIAKKYDVFTRLKDETRIPVLIKQLTEKVDAVPMSVMIATAGIYTNWGSSRLALQANSLYLEEIWYEDTGLKPLNDENAEYRYKTFSSLEESIKSKALIINSSLNYQFLRASRAISREMSRPPYGPQLAAKMMSDSNLKNIAGLIDYTFTFYHLNKTDFFPTLEDIQ